LELEKWLLNRMLERQLIPQACNQLISFTPCTAGTRQPFQSAMTGQLSKKLKPTAIAITPTVAETTVVKFMYVLLILCLTITCPASMSTYA
jgi:hypothetical protein